jgi:peptidoglycan-N-acetylglucosamine deacetylase
MKPATYITTSWDDGHPLDFRVAELLTKYGLRGTFYVPRSAKTSTMTVSQMRELSDSFEIGAHTLHHVDLTTATEEEAQKEIVHSKSWIEDSTSRPCPMFCPPKGKFRHRHLQLIRRAGYIGVRSVELLSLAFPRPKAGLMLVPTSLQAFPHGLAAYTRNLVKRAAFRNLWLYLVHGRSTHWPTLVRSLLSLTLQRGGVFHLWGHSWELQQAGQWRDLEAVLQYLGQFTREAPPLSNSEVCQRVFRPLAPRPAGEKGPGEGEGK